MSVISDIYDAKIRAEENRRFGNSPAAVYLGANLLDQLMVDENLWSNGTVHRDNDAGRYKVFGMSIFLVDEIGHIHVC